MMVSAIVVALDRAEYTAEGKMNCPKCGGNVLFGNGIELGDGLDIIPYRRMQPMQNCAVACDTCAAV